MAKRPTVAEKLAEARELIGRGWTQELFERETNGIVCYCAMGAILEVSCGESGLMAGALSRAINSQNIFSWNDAPERTQAEVLAAFDKAIELAQASA